MWMRRQDGQALVELAISITVLMMILLGIVEFGRIGHAYIVTTHASREGARIGALHHPDNEIGDAVYRAASTLDINRMVVSISPAQANRQRGDSLEVTVSYEVPLITPLGSLLTDPFPVFGRTTMRVE